MRHRPGRIVFVRHGESVWNINDPDRGLVARFTGWADVELTDKGRLQAAAVGRCLRMFKIAPDAVYTSLLRRSRDTFAEMNKVSSSIFRCPAINSWRLNERHYGALIGMAKQDAGYILGHDKVYAWRRSWDQAPPPMDLDDQYQWRKAPWAQPVTIVNEPGKKSVVLMEKDIVTPSTESLEDCAKRVKPIWVNGIASRVARGETVLVVAHANSIRSMIKHIDNETMDDKDVRDVHIPAATPLIYTFSFKNPSMYDAMPGTVTNHELVRALKPIGSPSRLGMTGQYVASKEIVRLALQASISMEESQEADKARLGRSRKKVTFFDFIEKDSKEILEFMDSDESIQKDALVVCDGNGVILHTNAAWQEVTGFSDAEAKGRTNAILQGPATRGDVVRKLDEKLRTGLPAQVSVINYRKNGKAFENEFTVIPVYDWLRSLRENNTATVTSAPTTDASPVRRDHTQHTDYSGGDLDVLPIDMHPSHFVGRLDRTTERDDIVPLSPAQMAKRDSQQWQAADSSKSYFSSPKLLPPKQPLMPSPRPLPRPYVRMPPQQQQQLNE